MEVVTGQKKIEVPTDQSKTKTLAKYSEFQQSCMDIQMTMRGEVAELIEDLATAHYYCEYTKLEGLETITWADKNDADIKCINEGTISKKSFHLVGSPTTSGTLRRRAAIGCSPPQPAQSRFAASPTAALPMVADLISAGPDSR